MWDEEALKFYFAVNTYPCRHSSADLVNLCAENAPYI